MKTVILAGGFGSRISEESATKPKPMIEIGGRPILWHIMKIYSAHGINDFIVCLGYKGYLIKEYFANYFLHMSDVTFDMAKNSMQVHQNNAEPWRVTLVDTGENTMTGGRIKRIRDYIGDEEFCATYGDGVGDVDITAADRVPPEAGRPGPRSRPPSRQAGSAPWSFPESGSRPSRRSPLAMVAGSTAASSSSRPRSSTSSRATIRCGSGSPWSVWQLWASCSAYKHQGFWQPMDTLRDKNHLEELWAGGGAPWKVW